MYLLKIVTLIDRCIMNNIEEELLLIAINNLKKVEEFDAYKNYGGNKENFKKLLKEDPAFCNLGLSNDTYVRSRVGGNFVTSLHRKIGDMYENMFSHLLTKKFQIPSEDLHFNVVVEINGRQQTRSTDGLILKKKFKEGFPKNWFNFEGAGFELRSCYQIGDSKRIQADYDMALELSKRNIKPIMLIFCNTSLKSPVKRLAKSWELYEGEDSFSLIKDITGVDLFDFMKRNEKIFSETLEEIISNTL